jgi:hypothetical protein
MNRILIILTAVLFFCSCACKEEEKPNITAENVAVPTSAGDQVKKETFVVDYSKFPNDKAGKPFWEKKVKAGKADISVVKDEELKTNVLSVKSDVASYYFQRPLDIDINKFEHVSWKWKVVKNPKGGDVRRSATDDQAIQVLLAFEGKYLISYIWDPTAPVGHSKDSSIPFLVAQKILVLESGDKNLNKWLEIRRDIKADFKKLYKKDPPKLVGIAVQANSQHTKTKCEAFLSPVVFEAVKK